MQRAFESSTASSAPVSMYRTWGASWELVGVPTPPLDFTLTDLNGTSIIARCASTQCMTAHCSLSAACLCCAMTRPFVLNNGQVNYNSHSGIVTHMPPL